MLFPSAVSNVFGSGAIECLSPDSTGSRRSGNFTPSRIFAISVPSSGALLSGGFEISTGFSLGGAGFGIGGAGGFAFGITSPTSSASVSCTGTTSGACGIEATSLVKGCGGETGSTGGGFATGGAGGMLFTIGIATAGKGEVFGGIGGGIGAAFFAAGITIYSMI